jgi:MFS family permease
MITRRSSPNYRWYILALAMLTVALIPGASRLCMPVLFKQISGELGLSLVAVGTVWGMDPLAGIFIGLPGGLLADRFGIKRTFTLVCLLAGIFGAMRGLSVNFTSLAATMFLFGLLGALTPNIVAKVSGLWFRGRRLGMANALLNVSWSLGAMVATMFSATVFSPLLGGWRNVMFLWGAPCILLGVLWFFTGREPSKNETLELPAVMVPFREALSRVIRVKGVWLMGLLTLAHYGATMGFVGYLPTYLRNIGWTPAAADSSITVLNGITTLGTIPMVLLSDKIGSRKAILGLSMISLTAFLALLPFVNSVGIWVLLIACGFLRSGGPTLVNVIIIEMKGVGGNYGATAMGLASTISMVGAALAPPIGNSFAHAGAGMPFLFWAGLSLLSLIPLLLVNTKTEKALHIN